jgi:hypothetical protein
MGTVLQLNKWNKVYVLWYSRVKIINDNAQNISKFLEGNLNVLTIKKWEKIYSVVYCNYPEFISTQWKHESKYHIVSHKYV